MTDLVEVEQADVELVDDSREFFAPVDADVIDSLLGQYASARGKIERVATIMGTDDFRGAVQYFLDGNSTPDRHYGSYTVDKMFALDGAIFKLNSNFWGQALALTDVYDTMPQARRDYWNAQLQGKTSIGNNHREEQIPALPDFEERTVRDTLADMLRQRGTFFAERIDGIFRGLSGEHVTNAPEAFGKRMIVGYMLSYGSIRHEKSGLINDLRCVIAKFMGRDEPKYNASAVLISELYKTTGQWVTVDGGTLRIRVYKKGTAHLEVHPDMAWRLNQVLASLYPLAIPAEFQARPKKAAKDFLMMGRPLPFATLELLAEGLSGATRAQDVNLFVFRYAATEQKAAFSDACNVLAALGGIPDKGLGYEFDYPIADILREVVNTGCLPDQKAHQFYPTPEKLARIAVDLANIDDTDTVLEPSAGQGGIADYLPKDRTTCIEISPLHCAVLKAKGFKTVEADFPRWAEATAEHFDCIVMNPPFSEGRAKVHVEYASTLVRDGGRLVAILPASMRGKAFLGERWALDWSPIYPGEFAGTGVAVVILRARNQAPRQRASELPKL